MQRDLLHDGERGCGGCVGRRDFLMQVAVVASAVIAAGCGGASDLAGVGSDALPGGSVTVKLADYPSLATVGQPVEIKSATGAPLGVAAVRTGANSFIALGMACTHEGTKVNIIGQIFDCPNHGARYSSTGAVTKGPATRSLVQRAVSYDAAAQALTVT